MKLKEIEIGQIVIDKFDNEYEVLEITEDNRMPIKLKCIKFVKNIRVQNFCKVEFYKVGQSFYIYKSKKVAKANGNDDNIITVKSLKLKETKNEIE